MNRFAVEEDAASEVLKIFELETRNMYNPEEEDKEFEEERKQKGMDLIT